MPALEVCKKFGHRHAGFSRYSELVEREEFSMRDQSSGGSSFACENMTGWDLLCAWNSDTSITLDLHTPDLRQVKIRG